MWRPYGTKLGLLATIGVLRLLAPTPPQAQTRCLRGTPFALVAQGDKNKKSSNGAPKGAPLQSKSQDSRENPHVERDNYLLRPRHLHELHLVAFHFFQTIRGQVHHVARVVGRKRDILAILRADIQMIDGVIGGGEWRG